MPDSFPPDDTALGSRSTTLEVGLRVFRQYVLKRFLGRGPLGSSWLVVHEGIGRELSMRFVPGAWIRDDQIVGRLRESVVRLLEITHPGLVGILDFARDTDAAAIVSKYVDSETALDARARRTERCFDVGDLRPWLMQVAEALDFAWRQHQATHGDLSPANLLVTPVGDVKIADFGLARGLHGLTSAKGGPLLEIAPAYCSPQRVAGEPFTVADDVYAFGATIYDLLAGKPPFYLGDVRRQMETSRAPSMAQRRLELGLGGDPIPGEWEVVIAACLSKRAEDRPKTVREAAERLGLLAPLSPAMEQPWHPTVLPRPHETVVGYRPPSARNTGPAPQFPTTMATEAMEAVTSRGEAPSAEANDEPAAKANDQDEAPPATVDANLDFEGAAGSAEATSPDSAAATPPARFIPPPLPVPVPSGDEGMATIAAEEPAGAAASTPPPLPEKPMAAEEPDATLAAKPARFIPPPPAQPTADDGMATIAAEDPAATPSAAAHPEEEHDVTLPAIPARFIPPPPAQPTEDDGLATMAAEEPPAPAPEPAHAAEVQDVKSEAPPARFIPPPPAEPIEDDGMATIAAEESPVPPPSSEKPEAHEEYDVTLPAPPVRFVPPPAAQPVEDDGLATIAAEQSAESPPPAWPGTAIAESAPVRFVPPPPAEPLPDDGMATIGAEEPAEFSALPPESGETEKADIPSAEPPPRFVPPSSEEPLPDDGMGTIAAEEPAEFSAMAESSAEDRAAEAQKEAPAFDPQPANPAAAETEDEEFDVTLRATPTSPPENASAEAAQESDSPSEHDPAPGMVVADENMGTVAAEEVPASAESEPEPSEPFVPPPPIQPAASVAESMATVAEEEAAPAIPVEPPRSVAPPPLPPPVSVAPLPPLPSSRAERAALHTGPIPPVAPNLEESVTLPTAVREARAAADRGAVPPAAPPTEGRRLPPYEPPLTPPRGFPWWVLAVGVLILAGGGFAAWQMLQPAPQPEEPAAPPTTPLALATPTPTPPPATPLPTPTPRPATPRPAGRAVGAADLAGLASQAPAGEALLLVGKFRVGISNPGAGGQTSHSIMRPVDAALASKVRVAVTHRQPPTGPAEGAVVDLTLNSRYFIQSIRQGSDNQINVDVEQR